jgi:hypothetical protein
MRRLFGDDEAAKGRADGGEEERLHAATADDVNQSSRQQDARQLRSRRDEDVREVRLCTAP